MLDLTVIIPAYNAARTVELSISSAISCGASHVLVVDDGSTDDTALIAADAGAIVIGQENQGASKARAAGVKEVCTEFLIFLDADDSLIAEGVQASIALLSARGGMAVVAGKVVGRRGDGAEVDYPRAYSDVSKETLVAHGFSPWPPAASVFATRYVRQADELPLPALHLRYADDYELLIRVAMTGDVGTHDTASCHYQLDGGKSATAASKVVECKEQIRGYYGSYLGLRWLPLSDRRRKAIVMARTFHGVRASGSGLRAVGIAAKLLLLDPGIAFAAIKRRLFSRSQLRGQ